jgi:hypothetical protein
MTRHVCTGDRPIEWFVVQSEQPFDTILRASELYCAAIASRQMRRLRLVAVLSEQTVTVSAALVPVPELYSSEIKGCVVLRCGLNSL